MLLQGKKFILTCGFFGAIGVGAIAAHGGNASNWSAPKLTTAELAQALEEKGRAKQLSSVNIDYSIGHELAKVERPLRELNKGHVKGDSLPSIDASFEPKVSSREQPRTLTDKQIPLQEYLLLKADMLDHIFELESALTSAEKLIAQMQTIDAATLIRSKPSENSSKEEVKALEKKLDALKLENESLRKINFANDSATSESKKLAILQDQLQQAEQKLRARDSVEADNAYLRSEHDKMRKQFAALEQKLAEKEKLSRGVDKAVEKIQKLAKNKESLENTLEVTRLENTALERKIEELSALNKKGLELQTKIEALNGTLAKKDQKIVNLNETLTRRDKELEEKARLEQDLLKLKNELVLKQTEVSLLTDGSRKTAQTILAQPSESTHVTQIPVRTPSPIPANDVLIAEITGNKVNLRSGPGDEHSPIMQVRSGTRLTVEDRQGDWLRVISPNGSRAYVRRDVVALKGPQEQQVMAQDQIEQPTRTELEEAFRKLNIGLRKSR